MSNLTLVESSSLASMWACVPSGLGYSCVDADGPPSGWMVENDFVVSTQSNATLGLTVYCTTDITNQTLKECQNPKCVIGDPDDSGIACALCTVLPQNSSSPYPFSYDCASASSSGGWNLSCPILSEQGICQDVINPLNLTFTIRTSNVQGIPQVESDESKSKRTWIIRNMDPTTFNVLADLVGFATRIFFGLASATLYPLIATWQLRRYKQPIPIQHVGVVPADVVHAATMVPAMGWTLPALFGVLLLGIVDFSHTIAMLGFDFIDEVVPGEMDTILRISSTERNQQRSYISAGDPSQQRTEGQSLALMEGEFLAFREQLQLGESFFGAITAIARSASPFTQVAPRPERTMLPFGEYRYPTTYLPDDSPLVSIDAEIPLVCQSDTFSIVRESIPGGILDDPLYNDAAVPNCTFSGIRRTGVFRDADSSQDQRIEIVEKMISLPRISGVVGEEVQLKKGNDLFHSFSLTHEQRKLARDRDNWRKGRTLDNVLDGIQIGNTTIISIGTIVYSSGTSTEDGTTEYSLFSEIVGACPNRPSGLETSDTHCLAVIRVECDSFPEDTETFYHELYAPIDAEEVNCELSDFTLLWGRNFQVDDELLAAVAGIHGQVRPPFNELGSFEDSVIPAALYSLATVELAPSIKTVVRAEVDILFAVFLMLPVALGIIIGIVEYRNRQSLLRVPRTPWEIMVVGKEEPDIPVRAKRGDPFPEPPEDLVLHFFDAQEDLAEDLRGSTRVLPKSRISTRSNSAVRSTLP